MFYESLVISTKIRESLRLELLWDKLLEPLQKLKKSDHSKKSVNNEITSIENYLFYFINSSAKLFSWASRQKKAFVS